MLMRKVIGLSLALIASAAIFADSASAQYGYYHPVAPRVVARPLLPPVAPVVSAHRPVVVPLAPPRRVGYASYVPVVPPPVALYRPPVVAPIVAAPPVRPVVVGPSVVGTPRAYVPGQPIRNALRFSIP